MKYTMKKIQRTELSAAKNAFLHNYLSVIKIMIK